MYPELSDRVIEQELQTARKTISHVLTNSKLHFLKSYLSEYLVTYTFSYLKKEVMAKLIGVVAHFVYWSVLGTFNSMPIDSYHMECLFTTVMDHLDEIKREIIANFIVIIMQKSSGSDAYPMTPTKDAARNGSE